MEKLQSQPIDTNNHETADSPGLFQAPHFNHPKKSKKILIIGGLFAIFIAILGIFVTKEYLRFAKFRNNLKKIQLSDNYKSYIKNIHTYLNDSNGQYINYRTCNVRSTDALWNFKQPDDSKYYSTTFSLVYNSLEDDLRIEQSDIKKSLPPEYKKNIFSEVAKGLDSSINKRQAIVNLNSSMDVLFNSNEYINYCQHIYHDVIDQLSQIKVNGDGTNTVVSGSDTDFRKKQADNLVITLGSENVPAGLEQVNQEFITTVKAIAATYGDVSNGTNTSESVKSYRAAFQADKVSLDKNLVDLASVAKKKITIQPSIISTQLKSVE